MILVGQRYDKLIVASKIIVKGRTICTCKCDCGNQITVRADALQSQRTRSCGCLKSPDLVGRKFGKLTVLNKNGQNKSGHTKWLCKCACGKEVSISVSHLNSGNTQSCGCLLTRSNSESPNWGGYGVISAKVWNHIKANARSRSHIFHITIQDAMELFIAQNRKCALTGVELNFAPSDKTRTKWQTASLDRIDSDIGYVKGNVQWVHKDVQLMKNDLDEGKFFAWAKRVADHSRLQGPPDNPPKLRLVKKQD